jgi:hypothetical protein
VPGRRPCGKRRRLGEVPTLTIALIGDPDKQGARISEDERSRSWAERRKIELAAGDDEPLGSIVDRALSEFGVVLGEGVISAHVVQISAPR